MKCPTCSGKMNDIMKEMDGFQYGTHQCRDCGEELIDMRQLKGLARKYKKLRHAKEVTFSQWGNSLAVRIPKEIAAELHIGKGSTGLLMKERQGIRIIPE